MARVPLEELVLQIHLLRLGPAAQFLGRVLEPPPPRSVAGAVAQLQSIGALTPAEQLTPLGDSPLTSPPPPQKDASRERRAMHNLACNFVSPLLSG
jgi:HrpA-like RNA helicase